MIGSEYTARHRSLLSAVAQGRASVTGGRFPCLCVDGRWCDQLATGELVRNGLVCATGTCTVDTLVPAALTAAGAAVLAAFGVTAAAA